MSRASRTFQLLRHEIAAQPWTPWGPRVLSKRDFAGTRVIVVGPAETIAEDLAGVDVDGHDVVVRLNGGMGLADARPELLGRRTDLLFHNLKEDGDRSAGAIPADLLRARGVRAVVYPHWRTEKLRALYRAKAAELARDGGPPLRLLPTGPMRRARADLGNRAPTIGTCAILFFLEARVAELAIHGFTFFETAYAPGYNDAVRDGADAAGWATSHGVHDPRSEKALIRSRLDGARAGDVTLGPAVRRHLHA